MPDPSRTLYDLLGVPSNCSFEELRRAFRERAKACHPDLFGGDLEMTERFQTLVNAFDILSDPDSRRNYDKKLALSDVVPPDPVPGHRDSCVMDTVADEILEELVVGNDAPRNTTLQSLMLDLERTERFMLFRQAKTFFSQARWNHCYKICDKLVDLSPGNILYHYYLAESAKMLGRDRKALTHYRLCLTLGSLRNPQQRLVRVRRHYRHLQRKQGWFGKFLAWLMDEDPPDTMSEEKKALLILEQTFAKDEEKRRRREGALPRRDIKPRGYLK